MTSPHRVALPVVFLILAAAWCSCRNPPGSSAPPDDQGDEHGDSGSCNASDSDGDTISDEAEGDVSLVDTDGDGSPDYLDLDSDDDARPDSEERGPGDTCTPPRDSDADGVPDYRDLDSDQDGLLDTRERELGTDRTREDTDGDDVTDLVEVGAGSDPLDPSDSPRTHGDLVFEVPYGEDPRPDRAALAFRPPPQKTDVFIAIDTSASMLWGLDAIRASVRDEVIPGVVARIPDVSFGIGRFEDCARFLGDDGGMECAHGCHNLLDVTHDLVAVRHAIDSLVDYCGGAEPYRQVLWLLATGDTTGYGPWVYPRPRRCTDPATVGWPCFRPDAVRIIIQFGDTTFEISSSCTPDPGWPAVVDAMTSASIRYVGVGSINIYTLPVMRALAQATGSVDGATGEPFAFALRGDGTFRTEALVDAVDQLARSAPIRLDVLLADGDDEPVHDLPVDAVTEFLDYLETNTSGVVITDPATGETLICTEGLETGDGDGDGHADFFPLVTGQSVCWDLQLRRNVTVQPLPDRPQIFRARIDIVSDGHAVIHRRDIFFLVKAAISPIR
jgi:hypothetical protein